MRSLDNLHKRATRSPADEADCIVPATVPAVRRLRDGTLSAPTVHNMPDDTGHSAEEAVAVLVDAGCMRSVHTGRQPPIVDQVLLRMLPDTAAVDAEPAVPRSSVVVVVVLSVRMLADAVPAV